MRQIAPRCSLHTDPSARGAECCWLAGRHPGGPPFTHPRTPPKHRALQRPAIPRAPAPCSLTWTASKFLPASVWVPRWALQVRIYADAPPHRSLPEPPPGGICPPNGAFEPSCRNLLRHCAGTNAVHLHAGPMLMAGRQAFSKHRRPARGRCRGVDVFGSTFNYNICATLAPAIPPEHVERAGSIKIVPGITSTWPPLFLSHRRPGSRGLASVSAAKLGRRVAKLTGSRRRPRADSPPPPPPPPQPSIPSLPPPTLLFSGLGFRSPPTAMPGYSRWSLIFRPTEATTSRSTGPRVSPEADVPHKCPIGNLNLHGYQRPAVYPSAESHVR